MRTFPRALQEAMQQHRLVPIVGAGVSMAVRPKTGATPRPPAFPSWPRLLEHAADRLDAEHKPKPARAIRALIDLEEPNYLESARIARSALGPTWFRFLSEHFDIPYATVEESSLDLARAVWELSSTLVVSLNYDRVLHWSCPNASDLREWGVEPPSGLAEILRGELKQPTVWHLHGKIDDPQSIILTPDGYSQLYPTNEDIKLRYEAALHTLRTQFISKTILFVGMSMSDTLFGNQLRWAQEVFADSAGPHFVLVAESEAKTVSERVRGLPIECIRFEHFGQPLVQVVHEIARLGAPQPGLNSSQPASATALTATTVGAPPSAQHLEPVAVVHSDISTTVTTTFARAIASASNVIPITCRRAALGTAFIDGSLGSIDTASAVIADISAPNWDVAMLVGYALGKGKRVQLVTLSTENELDRGLEKAGTFEGIHHTSYSAASDLINTIQQAHSVPAIHFPPTSVDKGALIYLVEPSRSSDGLIRAISRLKKTRIPYREFDTSEQPRLLPIEAHRGVSSAVAVVVFSSPESDVVAQMDNLRSALVVGLALAKGKRVVILQEDDAPLSAGACGEFVSAYKAPSDVDRYINELAPAAIEALQSAEDTGRKEFSGRLVELNLGESAAENEIDKLGHYYLTTDAFNRTHDGRVRLVVGRKGSGKTALFYQLRDRIKKDRKMVVLDLKPEGHQLKRFRDLLLRFLGDAVQEHVAKTFWEYVLFLELAHKLITSDQQTHTRDHNLFEPYQALRSLYHVDDFTTEGDFSERMQALVQRITGDFRDSRDLPSPTELSNREVLQLIYRHDVPALTKTLSSYLQHKRGVWILFDNIDKGWPTHGLQQADITVLRGLLDATRDIEKKLSREEIDTHTVVFLRNDVFERLVDGTPDRGKESQVSVDWHDVERLKELLRRRIAFSQGSPDVSFDDVWRRLCVSHIHGEDSAEYLISHSLMRPRYFLNLVGYCRGNAVDLRHQKITVDNITKAVERSSADLVTEIGLEIRDVFPEAEDILYGFMGAPSRLTLGDIRSRFTGSGVPPEHHNKLVETLLWFAFLGVVPSGADAPEQYAYQVFYQMKKLLLHSSDLENNSSVFSIHRAFWPFLNIQPYT